jgi:hypothetical protein
MLGSYSLFFTKALEVLSSDKENVKTMLKLKGYTEPQRQPYIDAFDFFCTNPSAFDGATIVKDLCDIPDLDLDAMLHDYHYLKYKVGSSFSQKWKADWLYAVGNERKGKGLYSAYSRFFALSVMSVGFVPYTRIKKGRLTDQQKLAFLKEYEILMK